MAWIDDRLWCHPKVVPLSDKAFRCYVNGLAYSSGFGMGGVLMPAHQTAIGATTKVRAELIAAGMWDELEENGAVVVHDWKEHNSKRDAKREQDRERKRRQRDRERDVTRDIHRDETVDVLGLKEVKEVTDDKSPGLLLVRQQITDSLAEAAS